MGVGGQGINKNRGRFSGLRVELLSKLLYVERLTLLDEFNLL